MKQLKQNFLVQWGVLVLALALLAGAVVHNLYRSYRDTFAVEQTRLLSLVRVMNVNLANQLHGTDHVLRETAEELALLPPGRWEEVTTNHRLAAIVDAVPGLRALVAADSGGTVRLSSHTRLLGSDVGHREYFAAARKKAAPGTLFVCPPSRSAAGQLEMNLVRVVADSAGSFDGVVVATLDPDFFATLLGSVNYAPDMWSAVVHGDGIQFVTIPSRAGEQGKNLATPGSFFSRHFASGAVENIFSGSWPSGGDRMTAVHTIHPRGLGMDRPLMVAASRDLAAIFDPWRRHAWQQGATFTTIALVSAVAMGAFQLYQRRQRRQAALARSALLESKQQLKDVVDFLPDPTFVLDKDKKVVIWNRAMEKISGVPKEEMIGKGDHEYTIPFYGCRRQHLLDLLELDDEELAANYSNIRRIGDILDAETFCPALNGGDGAYVWATGSRLYNSSGEWIGAIEIIRDVSDRKKTEESLRRLTHGIEHSASGVMITDVNGTIEYVNRKFTLLTGFGAEEALGQNPRILRSDATPLEVFEDLWKTILSGREWRGEILNRKKTGEVYWSIASISPLLNDKGDITHFIANFEDINERKNAEETIERLAYYDPLTDLPNRRMLQDRLTLAMKRSRRQAAKGVALLYIDLDRFKHINDTLGHPAGDALLREMAHRFKKALRDDDLVCRLGGDEFAVILHDVGHEIDPAPVAKKLLQEASRPMQLEGREVAVTGSVGIAVFPKDGEDASTLEKHADIALYHAKSEGKNTFRFFSEDLNASVRERAALEQGLRRLLGRDELLLHYQPRVSMATGRVVGVEALVRWESPEFGLVAPGRFIPLAEETHLIIPIGEWVLRAACRQQLAWERQGLSLGMAVNLSAVQFKSPDLVERVAAIIRETGIRPENLELELTESALVDKPERAAAVLESLRSLGCGISIDDFGTGYSSLGYLKNFRVTILKIDRTFVKDLADNKGDRAIAQSVVDLANNLSMETVAEGVEEPEQLEILREIGCTFIQGFLYAGPVVPEKIPQVVRNLEEPLRADERLVPLPGPA